MKRNIFLLLLLSPLLCSAQQPTATVAALPSQDVFIPADSTDALGAEPEKIDDKDKKAVVGYLDLEYAFLNHPWTVMSKEKLTTDIQKKARELNLAESEIERMKESEKGFMEEINALKSFYDNVYVDDGSALLPLGKEKVNTNDFNNLVSYLVFSGAEYRHYSPVETPEFLDAVKDAVKENRVKIKEKEIYVLKERSGYKDTIKTEEAADVEEILSDIYASLKLYSTKRNIKAVVNKKDILYGNDLTDITLDFTDRLKKDKKKRPAKTTKEEK